jgi:hypothetical protein
VEDQKPEIEDAIIVSEALTPEVINSVVQEITNGVPIVVTDEIEEEDDPLVPSPYVYSGVEEVPLLGGILYVAIKHGSAVEITTLPSAQIKIVVTTEGVANAELLQPVEFVFEPTFVEAKEFWEATVCPYIDTEVEPLEGYTTAQPQAANGPGRIPQGFRKTKRAGSDSEVACILKGLANNKAKNRSKNKAAKKSRAKNRK